MKTNEERQLHKRRALQERAMTARASGLEAAIAHDEIGMLHIADCRLCAHGRTAECQDCALEPLCDAALEVISGR